MHVQLAELNANSVYYWGVTLLALTAPSCALKLEALMRSGHARVEPPSF